VLLTQTEKDRAPRKQIAPQIEIQQHNASHCITLQHICCSTLQHNIMPNRQIEIEPRLNRMSHCSTLQYCSALQQTAAHAAHCSTYTAAHVLQHTAAHCAAHCSRLQHPAAPCSTLQHIAALCSTLQHTAAHCSTLQHTAAHVLHTLQFTAAHCSTQQHRATRKRDSHACAHALKPLPSFLPSITLSHTHNMQKPV